MTRPRDIADSINRINSSAADATAVTIDSSENVIVGATSFNSGLSSFAQLEASNSTAGGIVINTETAGASNYGRLLFTVANGTGQEGLIRYNTSDYHMSFWTNATERMRIDSSGNITMSNQPMFHARRTTTSTLAAGNFIVYDGAYVNRGSHYSTSNGKFTAPVAGVYAFFWDSIASNTNGTYRLYIYKNGSIAGNGDMHLRYNTTDNLYGLNASRFVLFDLAANDYIQIYFSSGAANLYSGNDYLTFGGYLLG